MTKDKETIIVTQKELAEVYKFEGLCKEYERLRRQVREKVLAGAPVQPGKYRVSIDTVAKRRVNQDRLRALLGPEAELLTGPWKASWSNPALRSPETPAGLQKGRGGFFAITLLKSNWTGRPRQPGPQNPPLAMPRCEHKADLPHRREGGSSRVRGAKKRNVLDEAARRKRP